MSQSFRVYDGNYPHFITSTVVYWLPIFCRDDYARIVIDSLTYCTEHKGLSVHGYILMPNHLHAICSQSDAKLPQVIRDFKGYTSREIGPKLAMDGRTTWYRALKKAGGEDVGVKVWQDEYHPEEVHSEEFFHQKLQYMHNNPVRAGYIDDPCEWKYSSAGFYYQEKPSLVPITPIPW